MSKASTQDLAGHLTKKDPAADLRIGVITAIDTGASKKVRTDQTDLAWIARSQDVQLLVGDRVWMVRQASTWIVAGRLSGIPSGTFCKRKLNSQAIANATLANDTDLAVALAIGTYRIELFAHYSSASDVADLRSAWAVTGGGTMGSNGRSTMGPGSVTTATEGQSSGSVFRSSGHGFATAIVVGTDSGLAAGVLHEDMLLAVTVAGTLQWQWAQGTTSAGNPTTVSTASRMYVTPTQVF